MKKIKPIHLLSFVVGLLAMGYGITRSVLSNSFHAYFELVFIGAVLVSLGLLNNHLK